MAGRGGGGGGVIAREACITIQQHSHSHMPAAPARQGTFTVINQTNGTNRNFALPCSEIMALPRSYRALLVTLKPDQAQQLQKAVMLLASLRVLTSVIMRTY